MECIFLFFLILIIGAAASSNKKKGPVNNTAQQQYQRMVQQAQQRMQQGVSTQPQQYARPTQPQQEYARAAQPQQTYARPVQPQQQYARPAQPQPAQRAITPEERARLEEYKRRKAAQNGAPIRPSQPNYVGNHSRVVAEPNIVERAKKNVSAIEAEQENVEVALAKPMDVKTPINQVETGPHSDVCIRSTHTEESEELEFTLGTVEDLIVMGYSGDLSGMRDFQAEADAMLSSYIF